MAPSGGKLIKNWPLKAVGVGVGDDGVDVGGVCVLVGISVGGGGGSVCVLVGASVCIGGGGVSVSVLVDISVGVGVAAETTVPLWVGAAPASAVAVLPAFWTRTVAIACACSTA